MCVILRVAAVLRQQGHRTEKRSPPPHMSIQKSRLSQRELLTGSQQVQTGTCSELCAERAVELFTRSSSRLHGAVRQLGAEQLEGSKCGTRRPGLLFRSPGLVQ